MTRTELMWSTSKSVITKHEIPDSNTGFRIAVESILRYSFGNVNPLPAGMAHEKIEPLDKENHVSKHQNPIGGDEKATPKRVRHANMPELSCYIAIHTKNVCNLIFF